MVKPVFDDQKLAHIESLNYEDLRPEFRHAMEGLVKWVLSRPKLKQVQGKYFTGSMLLGLAIEYVDAINE